MKRTSIGLDISNIGCSTIVQYFVLGNTKYNILVILVKRGIKPPT